jgi:hypothetical protein
MSNTRHPDLLTWAGAVPDKGDEVGDAGIEHAGCVHGPKAVRNREDQLLVSDDAGGVLVLGAGAFRVLAGLRMNRRIVSIQDVTRYKDGYTHVFVYLICKLIPVVVYTQLTLVVARDLRARSHATACLHRLHVLPHLGGCARGLIAYKSREWDGLYALPGRRCRIG